MAQKYVNSFATRKALKVGSESYDIFSLPQLEQAGFKNVSRLPISLKVLLENLLRQEDNHHDDDRIPRLTDLLRALLGGGAAREISEVHPIVGISLSIHRADGDFRERLGQTVAQLSSIF